MEDPRLVPLTAARGGTKHPITCCQKHHAWAPLCTRARTQLRADPRTPDPTPRSLGPCFSEPSWVPAEDVRGRGWRGCPQLPPKPPLACRCDQGNARPLSTHGPRSSRERSEDQNPAERHSPAGDRRGVAWPGAGVSLLTAGGVACRRVRTHSCPGERAPVRPPADTPRRRGRQPGRQKRPCGRACAPTHAAAPPPARALPSRACAAPPPRRAAQ